ncbi:hypothetical protein BV898_15960 [Hypsibius exemplaris]|uniref:Uncharacterized protein n=1 Tax=Hypsibius exemplaris TaxID=2072580 RepID=A0A9X6NDV4_HYPEX|nr:hypothetical protein BV898_15960 [Hypsibius exemplaris]
MVVVANKTDLEENLWKIDRAYVECLSCWCSQTSAIKKRRESMPNVFTALPRNFDALQQCKEMIFTRTPPRLTLPDGQCGEFAARKCHRQSQHRKTRLLHNT